MTSVTEDATPGVVDDDAIETSYGFDLQGRTRAQLTFAPGDTDTSITTSYLYDSLGRLDVMTDTDGDGNVTASYDYEIRADGRRTGSTETFWIDENSDGELTANELKASSYSWSYDDLNRLTDEVIDHWDDAFDQTESYTYDATGNRTRVERLSQSSRESIEYRYDANDRLFAELTDDLTSENADTTTIYGYDHTQQTEKTVYADLLDEATIASLVSGADDSSFQRVSSQTFTYNLQGRMSEAVVDSYNSDGTLDTRERSSYDYDMRSFRVGQTIEDYDATADTWSLKSDTSFLVSHRNHTGYAQTLRETTTNADGSAKVIDYTFGMDEIAQRVVERDDQGNVTSDTTHVFGHDGHGSVRVLYDLASTAANLIQQIATYSAYGVMIAMHSGNGTASPITEFKSTLTYSGEAWDNTLNKGYNRARWYDATTGQWNRLDPFVGNNQDPQSLHKYAYVHGDPIGNIDPSGLTSLTSVNLVSAIKTQWRGAKIQASRLAQRKIVTTLRNNIVKGFLKSYAADLLIINHLDDTSKQLALLATDVATLGGGVPPWVDTLIDVLEWVSFVTRITNYVTNLNPVTTIIQPVLQNWPDTLLPIPNLGAKISARVFGTSKWISAATGSKFVGTLAKSGRYAKYATAAAAGAAAVPLLMMGLNSVLVASGSNVRASNPNYIVTGATSVLRLVGGSLFGNTSLGSVYLPDLIKKVRRTLPLVVNSGMPPEDAARFVAEMLANELTIAFGTEQYVVDGDQREEI